MPADRLNDPTTEHNHSHAGEDDLVPTPNTLQKTERAILDVLTGMPLHTAATRIGTGPADLAAAIDVYRRAGRDALHHNAADPPWRQLSIQFTDWAEAETTVADGVAPLLQRGEDNGFITAWWFIRKYPCWRLRIRAPIPGTIQTQLDQTLDELTGVARIHRWWACTYEPETAAFGGTSAMAGAHELFHADSRAILDLHHQPSPTGRRELSILLCSTLIRAAGLEWYEMGDVWHRVAAERPRPTDTPHQHINRLAADLRLLMRADTTAEGPMLSPDGPLAFAAPWVHAFHNAGRILGHAARAGTLERGLRRVLAYHIIFHWNRLGLPTRTQSILATAARTAILEAPT